MNVTPSEIECHTILSLSRITLGEYVINPYRGCTLGCRYCYVQKNKGVQKRRKPWGSFVDVKVNAPALLRNELRSKSIRHVLIGSTTDVYQPCERRYTLMREILSILNSYRVGYTILTKSPLVMRDCDLFRLNDHTEIYFTVSPFPEHIRRCVEPYACSLAERIHCIEELTRHNITTHVYVNPILPYLVDPEHIFTAVHGATPYIDFESINIKMIDWPLLKTYMSEHIPETIDRIDSVLSSADEWNRYWHDLRLYIEAINKTYNYTVRTFFHSYLSYFGILPY